PRRRLAERGKGAHRLAEDRPAVVAVGVALAEVVLHRPWAGDDLERRVGDVLADLAPHDDLGATAHVHVVDRASVPIGQVAGQRVTGLVEVVVGVEHRNVEQLGHGTVPSCEMRTSLFSEESNPARWAAPPPSMPWKPLRTDFLSYSNGPSGGP